MQSNGSQEQDADTRRGANQRGRRFARPKRRVFGPCRPHPAARIRRILDDIGATFIVLESALGDAVIAVTGAARPLALRQSDAQHRDIDRQDPGPLAEQRAHALLAQPGLSSNG
jgi:hypothetical protein